ncbi:hypothetical protein N7510_010451 [Penicillium lagena]|uniref:uncharacterized protein n=1 Tax=Penicillium lagena TaxID=94218 RepID=UPI0025425992|nr:uncharacterized protein N7510_010451 [Penicillium lagena]KAJ5605297.1 hypothetical protein N7510_010451 [Penicillium lagena]
MSFGVTKDARHFGLVGDRLIDDLLIYSEDKKEYAGHVRPVFKRLRMLDYKLRSTSANSV